MRQIFGINIVLIFLWCSVSAIAAPVVAVDTDPSTPGVQHHISVAVGTSFTVNVVVTGVEEAKALNVFEFDLDFDPAIVRATSVVSGGFLPSPSVVIESDITPPDVNFAEGVIGPHTANGNGILATITFTALGAGVMVLDLNNVVLAALGGVDITGIIIDGAITVLSSTATLSLTPTTKTVTIGETFNVDVSFHTGGTETAGVDIRYLRYNPSVLAVLDSNPSIPGIQIQPGTLYPTTEANSVDASNGTIHFSQITPGGTTFNGSGVLATVVFKAVGVGTTELIFNFSPGVTTDTNVAIAGVDVLKSATGAHITAISDLDSDGISDDKDICPSSDLRSLVVIGGCDSKVPNTLFLTGCTISDQIMGCVPGARNHGQFVSCVAQLTSNLQQTGAITGQQKGAIQSCAAQANIP